MSISDSGSEAQSETRRGAALLRWTGAALAALAVHGGLVWLALEWRITEAAAGAPEPAVMIELAAVSVAPEAPAEPAPPAPERVEPEPAPEPVKEAAPPEPEQAPEPMTEPLQEPVQEPVPVPPQEAEIKLPELPAIPEALAVLASPPPRPAEPEKPVIGKPPQKPKTVERRPVERERPKTRQAAAPPPAPAHSSAPQAATQGASATPSVSTASWRGSLIAHLNRYKRFPGGASPGTVQVAFSIDRSGRVLSARLTGSSGDASLDEEAVAMIRRASPVPAPPSGIGGTTLALAVPVRFSR